MKIMKFAMLTPALIFSLNITNPVVLAKPKEHSSIKQDRQNGVVKWFNDAKGYGFIIDAKGEELFVHFRAIQGTGFKTLKAGQKVTFKPVKGQKGVQADEVQAL